ncbi:MAG: Bug family tripartite tricarboxylate transporter substrate binding protein [bacterium]|nr:tripartite tricarboxylate transporter substrate binding protein [Betaproteobacteria bacterium]
MRASVLSISSLRVSLPVVLAAGLAMPVQAQQAGAGGWPSRPVRIVVPFGPGGSADLVARILGQRLTESLGQPVIVENRPGAGAMLGNELVAKSPPDGYTLTIGTLGPFAVNQSLFRKVPYDSQRDFAPITLTGASSHVLVVHPSMPVKSMAELIALARQRPGQLTFASSGIGNATHLTGELFKSMAGVDVVHVPYKGGGAAVADLIGGHVGFSFASMPSAMPHVRAGKLRALAVAPGQRVSTAPELPTVAESGLPGFASEDWQGVLAPAKTPQDIVMRLNAEIHKVLGAADLREKLDAQGFQVRLSTPQQFADLIRTESAKWAKIVKEANIRID